jgi:putative transposase
MTSSKQTGKNMSRPLRLEFVGALYHMNSRGNGKKAIYLEESDF